MTLPTAPDPRLDRNAIERIIHRAAELQAGEREIGEGLTQSELMALGRDVGIPERYLQQALLEEHTRAGLQDRHGVVTWIAGPDRVASGRIVTKPRAQTEARLSRWMAEGELLQVKRRFGSQLSWEPRQGAFASLKRAFRTGGRKYILARAREISGALTEVEAAQTYVQLVADIGNILQERLGAAALGSVAGAGASAVALAIGVMAPIAAIPAIAGVALGWGVARRQRHEAVEVREALEQVLDRLEHGDLEPHRANEKAKRDPLLWVAEEIRKNL